MKVEIIKCLEDNFSYILINEANRNCCVVDPGEADPIINYLQKNKLNLKYILNTHHHHDHVGGNEELKKKFNAEVVGYICLLYTSPSPRDGLLSRMPSSA